MSFPEKTRGKILGKILTLRVHDLSRGGAGVCRDENGRVVFVPLTAPGDEIEARVVIEKKDYLGAELVKLLVPSPLRVSPRCPVFGACGGCQWQHLPYDFQWKTKISGLSQTLRKSGVSADTCAGILEFPAPHEYGYRNRIQLRGHGGDLGFFARGTHTLVPIEECPVALPKINACFGAIRSEAEKLGLTRHSQYKVEVDLKDEARWVFNQRHGALGFRQINDVQNDALRAWVASHAKGFSTVLDLFGGSGNLSRSLWDIADQILIVDQNPTKSGHAKVNVIRSDVDAWIRNTELPADAVAIIDPAREGWIGLLQSIPRLEVSRITKLILVECEPDPFARDVSRLTNRGWVIQEVAAFDFFPQTNHLETAAVLEFKA